MVYESHKIVSFFSFVSINMVSGSDLEDDSRGICAVHGVVARWHVVFGSLRPVLEPYPTVSLMEQLLLQI